MGKDQGNINAGSAGGLTGDHSKADPIQILAGPSTEDQQQNTVQVPLVPIACWSVHEIRFAFDSSFLSVDYDGNEDPPEDIRQELAALKTLVEDHQGCPLSIFGHADPVGTDVYNKSLSERRARSVYAVLIFQTDPDTAVQYWNQISSTENWGSDQQQVMQGFVGQDASSSGSDLIHAYLDKLSKSGPALQATDFLAQGAGPDRKGDFQGCSEFNPLIIFSQERQQQFDQAAANNDQAGIAERNAQNAPNRRVLGLMFAKGTQVDPSKWPCPRASDGISGCVKRFWADGEKRRSTHLSGTDRRFQDKHDTFACRFYQRLVENSPCENIVVSCWPADYEKRISGNSYGRYFRKWQQDGVEYGALEMAINFRWRLYVPMKTGGTVTVEVKFKAHGLKGVTDDEVTHAKSEMEFGILMHWAGVFTLVVNDPVCGERQFPIVYKIVWVTSGQDYTLNIHTKAFREYTADTTVEVSKDTGQWTYAHEFGHCLGLPDEYSYVPGATETVRYIKPDKKLGVKIAAPFDAKTSPPYNDITIMSTYDCNTMLERHAWNVAIEAQKLLRSKLGRLITCDITGENLD
jgi:outer membrane protein OmpA-like peptidoglycan-associated protein